MSAVLHDVDMERLLDRLAPAPGTAASAAPGGPAARRPSRVGRPVWVVLAALAAGAAIPLGYQRLGAQVPAPSVPAQAMPAASPPAPAAADAVLQASGYVVAERQATVSAEVTGRLAALHVRAGDRVKKGQLLAELDPSTLDAQIALAGAELAAERQGQEELAVKILQAEGQLARVQDLVREGFVSKQQAENEHYKVALLASQRSVHQRRIEVAERQLQLRRRLASQLRVVAPFDGIVTESAAQVGEIVSPISAGAFTRSGICTMVDLQSLGVEVKVNEKFIQRVQPGQPVQVSLHADASVRQAGRVSAVMPAAERETGTVKVRIALRAPDARVLPNMGVDVAFLGRDAGPSTLGATQ
jgi:HlyD family secretion protein